MLLGFFYTSNLRAFILLPSYDRLIDSDADVANQADVKIAYVLAYRQELEGSDDPFG